MDLLKSFAGGHSDKPADEGNKAGHHGHHQSPSTTELLSSAKVVAEAAKSAASNQTDKIDKGKAAGAAADLLEAASEHGKLGDKGVGKYVDQAKDYLRQYESKNSGTGGHGHAKPSDHVGEHKPSSDHGHDGKKKGDSKGGVGDYFKAAQGFLQKN